MFPNLKALCIFCFASMEDHNHLFLRCPFLTKVLLSILNWLDISFVTPQDVVDLYGQIGLNFTRKKEEAKALILVCDVLDNLVDEEQYNFQRWPG